MSAGLVGRRGIALLGSVALAAFLVPISAAAAPSSQADERVGRFSPSVAAQPISRDDAPNVLASPGGEPSQADTQVEPSIAVDQHNLRYVVAVFQQSRFNSGGSVAPGYAHSSDGGETWRTAMLPGLTRATGGPFDRGSDAVVTFGPNGAVFANSLVFNVSGCRNAVAVQVSHDHGATFGLPVFVADSLDCSSNLTDKNWITVDSNHQSPHFGRAYVVWDEYNYDLSSRITSVPEIERYSDDGGATWSSRITVTTGFNDFPTPLVEPNGNLVVVHNMQDPSGCCVTAVAANVSTNGGRSFGPTILIDSVSDTGPTDLRYGGPVSAAVDAASGELYATWSDSRYNVNGRDDVVLTHSTDGGSTWSKSVKVDQSLPTSQVDHLTPMVAADSGNVVLTYLSRDETSPSTARYPQMIITRSGDHGATFGGPMKLGPRSDLAYAATAYTPPTPFLGDYTGLTAAQGRIYVAWNVSSAPPVGSTSTQHQLTWASVIAQRSVVL